MADVEISYGGSTIVTMSDSGTEILDTDGTYMTDNITVAYTKSGIIPTGTKSITISGSGTITEDVTNYASASITTPSGTAGTPSATKGTVSNHAVSITPKVTNTAGWIAGSTKTGTAVSVTASELVSGTKSITSNDTGIDVTNYASVNVAVPTGITPTGTISITQNGTVDVTSYATANVNVSGGGGGSVATGAFSITFSSTVAVAYTDETFEVRTSSLSGTVSGIAPLNTIFVVSGSGATGGTNIVGLTLINRYRSNVAWYKVTAQQSL